MNTIPNYGSILAQYNFLLSIISYIELCRLPSRVFPFLYFVNSIGVSGLGVDHIYYNYISRRTRGRLMFFIINLPLALLMQAKCICSKISYI